MWLCRWRWWGDCLADVALLRGEPALFGRVASDSTVSRLVDTLAADAFRMRLAEQEPFRRLMERQYRVLLGGDDGPKTRVSVALLTAAIMGGVIHPLVSDVDNDTLRGQLLGVVRKIVDATR
jgi:hypothetical protein